MRWSMALLNHIYAPNTTNNGLWMARWHPKQVYKHDHDSSYFHMFIWSITSYRRRKNAGKSNLVAVKYCMRSSMQVGHNASVTRLVMLRKVENSMLQSYQGCRETPSHTFRVLHSQRAETSWFYITSFQSVLALWEIYLTIQLPSHSLSLMDPLDSEAMR